MRQPNGEIMNTKLKALKLILDDIKIPSRIATVEDRKKVQKAIYLGQAVGVDLGFHFGWYKMGPYSPELTKDYYDLAEELSQGDMEYNDNELAPEITEKLKIITSIIKTPQEVGLSQDDWMELLASHHFLRKNYSLDETREKIKLEKARLVPFIDKAENVLREQGMLNN